MEFLAVLFSLPNAKQHVAYWILSFTFFDSYYLPITHLIQIRLVAQRIKPLYASIPYSLYIKERIKLFSLFTFNLLATPF